MGRCPFKKGARPRGLAPAASSALSECRARRGFFKGTSPHFFLPLFSVLFLSSQPLFSQGHAKNIPWKVGEKFLYDIRWGLITAGEASMEVQGIEEIQISTATPQDKAKVYHIIATAHSTPFVDVFHKVRDKNESWLDVERWVTHRFEQHNQEGKYFLDQIVEYDWKKLKFHNLEEVKGRDPKIEEGILTVPAVDVLSSLYLTRTREFAVGDTFTLDVHSGRDWPLIVKVLKRETIEVDAGEFDCFLVEPFIRERGLFAQKGKKIQVWLTADERKIPVLMKAEIFIGHIRAELIKIKE